MKPKSIRSAYEVSVAFRPIEAATAETGNVPTIGAPFTYMRSRPPGTFEITRLASGRVTCAMPVAEVNSARPSAPIANAIAASFDIARISCFASVISVRTRSSRSTIPSPGSPRRTNIADALVAASVSPSSRSDTGHIATRRFGNGRPVSRR